MQITPRDFGFGRIEKRAEGVKNHWIATKTSSRNQCTNRHSALFIQIARIYNSYCIPFIIRKKCNQLIITIIIAWRVLKKKNVRFGAHLKKKKKKGKKLKNKKK